MSLKGLFNARWPGVALFDLDGTLVDSAPDLAAAVDQMLEHLGRSPAGLDKVRNWVGNGAQVLVRRALAGKTDWEPATAKDDALFNDALAIFYHAYGQMNGQHSVVFPGVHDCLEHLKQLGCRMAVVTNKPDQFVQPLLEKNRAGSMVRPLGRWRYPGSEKTGPGALAARHGKTGRHPGHHGDGRGLQGRRQCSPGSRHPLRRREVWLQLWRLR